MFEESKKQNNDYMEYLNSWQPPHPQGNGFTSNPLKNQEIHSNNSELLFTTVGNFLDKKHTNIQYFCKLSHRLDTIKKSLLKCSNPEILSCLKKIEREFFFIIGTKNDLLSRLLLLILKCKAFYGHDKDKYHKELENLITDNKKAFYHYRWLYRPKIGLDKILKDHPKELIFIFYFSGNPKKTKETMGLCAKYKKPSNAFRCDGGCERIKSEESKTNIKEEFEDALFYIVSKKNDNRFNKFFKTF